MKAIVFDLDGTLIDSAPDLHQAANKLLADLHDKPLDLATIRSFIGNGVPKLVERLLAARNRTQAIAFQAEMTENFLGHYNAALFDKTRLYPGVITCLEVLKAMDIKLGICTNKPEKPTLAILSGLNLDRFFTSVIGGDSLTVKKPAPEPLFHAFDALGVNADMQYSDCLYVGDSEVDQATAKAANIPFALFTEGYRKTSLEDMACERTFKHFDELLKLVQPV